MPTSSELWAEITKNRQELGQRQASAPVLNTASDPVINSLTAEHDAKARELFEYDMKVAPTYFKPGGAPGPHVEGYQPPEQVMLDPLTGIQAASIQTKAIGNELTDIRGKSEKRRDFLMDIYQQNLRAHQEATNTKREELKFLQDLYQSVMSEEREDKKTQKEQEKADKLKEEELEKTKRRAAYLREFQSMDPKVAVSRMNEALRKYPQERDIIKEAYDDVFGDTPKQVDPTDKANAKLDVADDIEATLAQPAEKRPDREVYINRVAGIYQGLVSPEEVRQLVDSYWPAPKSVKPAAKSSSLLSNIADFASGGQVTRNKKFIEAVNKGGGKGKTPKLIVYSVMKCGRCFLLHQEPHLTQLHQLPQRQSLSLCQELRCLRPKGLGEGEDGTKQFAHGLGLPVEDIGETFGETPGRTFEKVMGKVTPFAKVPLELGTGKNLFLGKDIKDVNYVPELYAKTPGLKQILGIQERENSKGDPYYVSTQPELLHTLTSALGRFYTTGGKLSSGDMSIISKILYFTTGAKVRGVDIDREKEFRQKERVKELEEFLEKNGVLRKFERYFKPKE